MHPLKWIWGYKFHWNYLFGILLNNISLFRHNWSSLLSRLDFISTFTFSFSNIFILVSNSHISQTCYLISVACNPQYVETSLPNHHEHVLHFIVLSLLHVKTNHFNCFNGQGMWYSTRIFQHIIKDLQCPTNYVGQYPFL